jgi:hypothetical protein
VAEDPDEAVDWIDRLLVAEGRRGE